MDAFFPLENALQIIKQFENKTLPKNEWTHEAHLMVGLCHAAKYGEKAIDYLRPKIMDYNESVGTINSESSGYHETLTCFWLWAVKHYCSKAGILTFNQTTLDDMLWTEELADRNLWLTYYSKELMMSKTARLTFVNGDLQKKY